METSIATSNMISASPIVDRSSRCRLLELPGELRNRIYEITFLDFESKESLRFSEHRCEEHALLRTCRQIRREATSIYVDQSTKFYYVIVSNMTLEPQLNHWLWTRLPPEQRVVENWGELRWDDLIVWFKKCHEGAIEVEMFGDEAAEPDHAVERAFEMVTEMRSLPWANVSRVLNAYKDGVETAARRGVEIEDVWD